MDLAEAGFWRRRGAPTLCDTEPNSLASYGRPKMAFDGRGGETMFGYAGCGAEMDPVAAVDGSKDRRRPLSDRCGGHRPVCHRWGTPAMVSAAPQPMHAATAALLGVSEQHRRNQGRV